MHLTSSVACIAGALVLGPGWSSVAVVEQAAEQRLAPPAAAPEDAQPLAQSVAVDLIFEDAFKSGDTCNWSLTRSSTGLVLNELDYDNTEVDDAEFVEILNASEVIVNLVGLALVLVNGSNETEYARVALDEVPSLAPGQYLVVGSQTVLASLPGGVEEIAFGSPTNNIQNGPDAIGILDTNSGTLIDALSYEGSVTAGILTGVPMPVSFVHCAPTSAVDDGPGTLVRLPNGSSTNNDDTDWAFAATATPGAAN
jgi:hypothetical protein